MENLLKIVDGFNTLVSFPSNIIIVITLLVCIYTGCVMLFKYYLPVKNQLARLNQPILNRIGILLNCFSLRKTARHFRYYLELAIVRSQGKRQEKKFWKELKKEFKDLISEDEKVIEVDTCFQLTCPEFNEAISRYFVFLRGECNESSKRARWSLWDYGVKAGRTISFLSDITIKQGYLAPMTLLAGLEERFSTDWPGIVEKYSYYLEEHAGCVVPEEMYGVFAWLMWGPSISAEYDKSYYKLVQYGFGDENNSINVVLLNDTKSNQLWDRLMEGNKTGMPCVIRGKLYDCCTYLEINNEYNVKNISNFESKAVPFIRRLINKDLGMSFLLQYKEHKVLNDAKSRNPLYSAYVWLMFVKGPVDDLNPEKFTIDKSLVFFEHPNLGDINNYNFMVDSLIHKCMAYFIQKKPRTRYCLCLCFNMDIKNRFEKALSLDDELSKYVVINKYPMYENKEILEAIDDFFPFART